MNVTQALQQRHSIRGFKTNPVPDEIIKDILQTASYSASNCNTQPWHVTIVSGQAREQLAQDLVAEVMSGKAASPAFKSGIEGLSGIHKERQYECAACLYGTMSIERSDRAKRNELMLQNWQFFGAPHVAFIAMPLSMGPTNAVDIGVYLQSLMLLMVERGLDSCPQGALAFYPEPIHKLANIPEGYGIICGLSFGYADKDAQINKTRTPRDVLESTVDFIR